MQKTEIIVFIWMIISASVLLSMWHEQRCSKRSDAQKINQSKKVEESRGKKERVISMSRGNSISKWSMMKNNANWSQWSRRRENSPLIRWDVCQFNSSNVLKRFHVALRWFTFSLFDIQLQHVLVTLGHRMSVPLMNVFSLQLTVNLSNASSRWINSSRLPFLLWCSTKW